MPHETIHSHALRRRIADFDHSSPLHSEIKRARVQQLIEQEKVLVNGATAKSSLSLRARTITVTARFNSRRLKAEAEDIPSRSSTKIRTSAVINKPAGMMVHAGAGATSDARSRGTDGQRAVTSHEKLSAVGGEPASRHRAPARQRDRG